MKRSALYTLLLAQLLILVGLYAWNAAQLEGPTYLLNTVPVDPRDLFRGDYIILSYEISQLPPEEAAKDWPNRVWVSLRPVNGFSVIDQVSRDRPTRGGPWIRATRKGNRLEYDIEKYFVTEGHGRPTGKITVEITVDPTGQAHLRRLFADGIPWK